jgi:hypothetical protein
MTITWPPTVEEVRQDAKKDGVPVDLEVLQTNLDAAVSFVQRVRPQFNYTADATLDPAVWPDPTPDLKLGTMRLAARWFARRTSPEALVEMGDLAPGRIPSFDPDIDRLLGIGRYQGLGFA